ncbi:MAG: NAD-dependent epimerase/dehydratase family protein, partial [Acidimicrobiia bacterium]
GHEVVAIDREPVDSVAAEFHLVDMTDYPAVVEALVGTEVLIHLAAITGPGLVADHVVHDHNVTSSYHALRAAAEVGVRRVCQASSVNAIGGRFSREARYDYFPVDEEHPAYPEDPYSLSKWVAEHQAAAISRRFGMPIASLRLHGIVETRADAEAWNGAMPEEALARQLWGYTLRAEAARACLLAVTADFEGHEAFYVVAPDTMAETPSPELRERWYPDVPLREALSDGAGFFDGRKAAEMLEWEHPRG